MKISIQEGLEETCSEYKTRKLDITEPAVPKAMSSTRSSGRSSGKSLGSKERRSTRISKPVNKLDPSASPRTPKRNLVQVYCQ